MLSIKCLSSKYFIYALICGGKRIINAFVQLCARVMIREAVKVCKYNINNCDNIKCPGLGQGEGGVEVDITAGSHPVTVTVPLGPAVSRPVVRHFVAVQWGQPGLGRGLVVLLLGGGLGAQGPVGRQHRQPDGHGDQDQEGRGGE